MDTSFLCAELGEILAEEIALGNEIFDVVKGGWTKIDVIVYLKFPFRKNYESHLSSADITFYRNEDPHYEFEDSYSSAIYRQALSAPLTAKWDARLSEKTFRKITNKILLMFSAMLALCPLVPVQENAIGKINSWTLGKVSSREKDDEILPVSYKMRASKNKGFDRVVFEFEEREVPAYWIRFRLTELSNPARLVVNFKNSEK